jgi:hypothetical protein
MSGSPQSESPSKDVNTLTCHHVPCAGTDREMVLL